MFLNVQSVQLCVITVSTCAALWAPSGSGCSERTHHVTCSFSKSSNWNKHTPVRCTNTHTPEPLYVSNRNTYTTYCRQNIQEPVAASHPALPFVWASVSDHLLYRGTNEDDESRAECVWRDMKLLLWADGRRQTVSKHHRGIF